MKEKSHSYESYYRKWRRLIIKGNTLPHKYILTMRLENESIIKIP
jgi:hypothetical protein